MCYNDYANSDVCMLSDSYGWGQFISVSWSFSFWFTFQSRYQLILDFYQLDQTNTPKLCTNTPKLHLNTRKYTLPISTLFHWWRTHRKKYLIFSMSFSTFTIFQIPVIKMFQRILLYIYRYRVL